MNRVGGKKESNIFVFEPGSCIPLGMKLGRQSRNTALWNQLGSPLEKSCASSLSQNHLDFLKAQSLSRQYKALELDLC